MRQCLVENVRKVVEGNLGWKDSQLRGLYLTEGGGMDVSPEGGEAFAAPVAVLGQTITQLEDGCKQLLRKMHVVLCDAA